MGGGGKFADLIYKYEIKDATSNNIAVCLRSIAFDIYSRIIV